MKKYKILIFASAMFIIYSSCVFASPEGKAAPDFTTELYGGTVIKLSEMKGRPVVLNFWASWCGYCVKELPDIEALFKKYGDKVSFLAVNCGESRKEIESFLKKKSYTFPIAMDETTSLSRLYNISGIPRTIVLDKEGKIIADHIGMILKKELEKSIEEALE